MVGGDFRSVAWLFILIVQVFIGGVWGCPAQCVCGDKSVRCFKLPLSDFSTIPADTNRLILLDTDLLSIKAESLFHLDQMVQLELNNNKISQIPTELFDNLPDFQRLKLIGSNINCDCVVFDKFNYWRDNGIDVELTCHSPAKLNGKKIRNLSDRDISCNNSPINPNSPEREYQLITKDSDTFICRMDESLNLDVDAFKSSEVFNGPKGNTGCVVSTASGVIKGKIARVELMKDKLKNSDGTQFKTKIFVRLQQPQNLRSEEEVILQCPQTGTSVCVGEFSNQKSNKPTFLFEPFDIDAYAGTTIELPCQGEGEPAPEVKWKKDGKTLIQTAKHRLAPGGSLYIKKISSEDAGRYECSVKNENGRITASALIIVKSNEVITPNDRVRVAFADAERDINIAIKQTINSLFGPNKTNHHGELFKINRYPKGDSRELARAAELYERTLLNIRKEVDSGASINANTTDFDYKDILSQEHLDLIAQLSGCQSHRLIPNCTNMCYHLKYRAIDGTCNNLQHPHWGASLTGFRRILKPTYENGFSTPIGWNKGRLYHGYVKPSARLVSTKVISTNTITQDDKITHMVMQWGQFLDHDLDHAIPSVSSESWDGVDCKKTCEHAAPCYPIEVPPNDPRVTNRRCIDLVRSSAICGSGMTSILFDSIQPREQINQLTSYIDASQVYGFSLQFSRDLRNLTSEDGLLRTGVNFPKQKSMLPFAAPTDGIDCRRDVEESTINCFAAGDIRVNEQIGLAAMHTIWLREHNRIAKELKEINFHWDGETLYQEARKIVGAQMQLFTFEHWLPIVLGEEGMRMLGPYKGYDPTVNPSISNEFATAALRFGHTLINPILHRLNETFEPIPQGHLPLHRAFFSPWRLVLEGGVDPLMRGMYSVAAKLKLPGENLNTELTEKLFFNAHAVALDLAAINIQRSRDHGIPGYNEYRKQCNLPWAETFDDLKNEISNADVRQKLKQLYGHPGNIDIFVGGILEDQVDGAKIGPTFRCLLIEQFSRLRSGDRHWYENPSTFRPEQISQIKLATLGRVLCDNGDNITQITDNVFFLPGTQGGYKRCDEIPKMNLAVWLNCDKCTAHQDPNIRVVDPNLPRQRRSIRSKRDTANTMNYNSFQNDTEPIDNVIDNHFGSNDMDDVRAMMEGMQMTVKEMRNRIKKLEYEQHMKKHNRQSQMTCVDSTGVIRGHQEEWTKDECTRCKCEENQITCMEGQCTKK